MPLLDDSHDDDGETFALTLSNPSGARIADGAAMGMIHNSDPMPQAWLARFGRTVGKDPVENPILGPAIHPGVDGVPVADRSGKPRHLQPPARRHTGWH